MADDYLGRKMEEYMARKASGQSNRRPLATLGRLLLKNRSHRGDQKKKQVDHQKPWA